MPRVMNEIIIIWGLYGLIHYHQVKLIDRTH